MKKNSLFFMLFSFMGCQKAAFARISILCCLMALAFLINPDVARAQNYRNCAWPIEISPEGSGNMLGPDTLSRYWVMPLEKDQTMTIKGAYPDARYFSFVAYNTNDNKSPVEAAGALYDAQIAPDQGSVNPFVHPATGFNGTYTVVISHGQTSGNTIGVSSDFAWVLLRLYVPRPDPSLSGQSLIGGVPLPTIFLTKNGASQELPPCPSVTDPINDRATGINKLADVIAFLQIFFPQVPTPFDLIGHEGTPSSDRLWFAPPTVSPPALLPNPDNKYMAMLPGENYQPGRIIVIHGKLPGTPDTYDGSPISVPARGFRTVDMRYWSLCIDDFALPVSVVNCTADLTTDLQGGDYTIVISDDQLRPDWLRPDINWLPWGDAQYLKIVFLRNMLPAPNFPFAIQNAIKKGCTFPFDLPYIPQRDVIDTAGQCAQQVMRDYYPVAAWCDKSTFVHGGWRACVKGK